MEVRPEHKMLAVSAVVLCLFVGVTVTRHVRAGAPSHRSDPSPHQPLIAQSAPYAAVTPVVRGTITNPLSIAGQFVPYQSVELHAKVAGYIKNIYVDIGDHVHAGQVLAVLEIPELMAQVNEAQAATHHAAEEILRAKSDVARAEADHVALHANALRLSNTDKARPGLIAQQELDDAEAKDRAAEAQVDAAKSAMSAAKQQLEVARADQQHYSALSEYARITAPYDGVVTWRYADTGALVQAGTSSSTGLPVVTVADMKTLRLRIPAPASIAAKVRAGDPAQVRVQSTGESFTGKVTRFTDTLDTATSTMQVEIDVPNPQYRLQPGMYADVTLMAGQQPDALIVPVTAVQQSPDGASVFTVDPNNRVQKRQVRLGAEDANRVQILAGLSDGDRVIIGNLGSYRDGEQVRPKESAPLTASAEME